MNKITRKSFLKVLAATMVGGAAASALTGAAAPVSIDETNGKVSRWVKNSLNPDGPLTIAKQGMFSSGGTVTAPVAGTYDATTNWLDTTRAGNTAHVDHANVLYQIPADSNGWPMVYLHGYGQSRMGWITTPDGRQGWADLFLRNGYSAFLVDQPRPDEHGRFPRYLVCRLQGLQARRSGMVHPLPHWPRCPGTVRRLPVPGGRCCTESVLPPDDPPTPATSIRQLLPPHWAR